jgi:Zonular occludens toxin (Zot)
MPISGIYGLPGKGKTQFSLEIGIQLAEEYQYKLITNFPINPIYLARYLQLKRYNFLLTNIHKQFIYCPIMTQKDLTFCLDEYKESIIIFDELHIILPARSHNQTNRDVISAFSQCRHQKQHIFYVCQNHLQIDSFIRNIADDFYHCNGMTKFNLKLKMDKLIIKNVTSFTPESYEIFLKDPKIKRNPIKCKLLGKKQWQRILNKFDILLFKMYNSFEKVETILKSDESLSKIIKLKMTQIKKENVFFWIGKFTGINPIKPLKGLKLL